MKVRLTYFLVYLLLMALLFVTWGLAYLPLGKFHLVTGLTIAVVKLGFIALVFMELKGSNSLRRLFAVSGVIWFAILISLAMNDYLTRNWLPLPSRWPQPSPFSIFQPGSK